MEEFSVTINSSSSKHQYPNNKPASFRVVLNQPLEFPNGEEWEVGVSLVGFENTWQNIKTQCVFKVKFSVVKDNVTVVDSFECKFKPGYYDSAETIIQNINWLIRSNLSEYITRQTALVTTLKVEGIAAEGENDENEVS